MKKGIAMVMVLLCFTVLFDGCAKTKQTSHQYVIYELNTERTALEKVPYAMKAKTADKRVAALLAELATTPDNTDYTRVLPSNIKIEKEKRIDHNLELTFNAEYSNLSNSSEVLIRAAIVETMLQLDEVTSVSFMIEGAPLTDHDGNLIGPMDKNTFVNGMENGGSLHKMNLTLYYSSKDGQSLIAVKRKVTYNSNNLLAKVVLTNLTEAPDRKGMKAPLSDASMIKSVSVADGICYLRLDSSFISQTKEVSETTAVYAIVNSLTELDSINKVQITLDGEDSDMSLQLQKISGIYEKKMDLVKNEDEVNKN